MAISESVKRAGTSYTSPAASNNVDDNVPRYLPASCFIPSPPDAEKSLARA